MCGEITKKTKGTCEACNAANRLEGGDGGFFFSGVISWDFMGCFWHQNWVGGRWDRISYLVDQRLGDTGVVLCDFD